jgi:hypothetical protein
MVLEVWPTHTLPHSHGMQYTPDVLRPRLSLMGLKMLEVYLNRIWIVLMLCFATSLLILLDVKCWYAIKALSKKQQKFNYMPKTSTGRLALY